MPVLNERGDLLFSGNSDEDSIVTREFFNPIFTANVKLRVESYEGEAASLRWALIGCNGGE